MKIRHFISLFVICFAAFTIAAPAAAMYMQTTDGTTRLWLAPDSGGAILQGIGT